MSAPSGRPSIRTDAIIDIICNDLSEGITLREICQREGMPHRRTVNLWRKADPDLFSRIARAREEGFDAIADESLMIADDGSNDYLTRTRPDGSTYEELNAEHIQRSRLRAEHRLKLLAKWDRKNYGDKTDLNVSGQISLEAWVLQSLDQPVPVDGQSRVIKHMPDDRDD